MKELTKAVAYCRTASIEQKDYSQNYQHQQLTVYAQSLNLEITKWFDEVGSGRGSRSVVLQKALKYCTEHGVSNLIVSRPDRISRSLVDYRYWEQAFRNNSVHLHFTETLNHQDSPAERFMQDMTLMLGAFERQARSDAIKRGIQNKKLKVTALAK